MYKTIFAVVLFLSAGVSMNGQRVPQDLRITLQRDSCPDSCPFYLVTIKADGRVSFFPVSNMGSMTAIGPEQKGHIDKDQVSHLFSELVRTNFDSFPEEIMPGDNYRPTSECPAVVPDFPTAAIFVTAGGKTKMIRNYLGCQGSSSADSVENLENLIEEITNTQQWITEFRWTSVGVVRPVDFP